ncbi:hypothetical protein [Amycolatopsis sp. NPDC059657]|uniref:hypothetical protein n=1 Tax=Amycolatopsis sp. NPDC059657 TaxID=3346899 RepID=UPI00366D2EDE
MKNIVKRAAACALFAAVAGVGPVVLASPASASVAVKETRTFNWTAYENSPKEAIQKATKTTLGFAAAAQFSPAQCAVTWSDSTRLGPGYYAGSVVLSCTR